jgi:hypothetical protein
VATLGKAAFAAPIYISVSWTLMISYQLFTQTAVTTKINTLIPSIGFWLSSRIDMVVFIYAFAWVFLLSSAIPSLILGKERGVLAQFFMCLTLTFLAFALLDVLQNYAGASLDQLLSFAFVFNNPVLAALYLSLPYVIMIALDLRTRKRRKARKGFEDFTETYVDPEAVVEQNYQEAR